jgi:indolepyruvate ferredoxin oxidoreductase, beta subunit
VIEKADILVAGVGGQGTLLASDILAEVGMRAGYDVKKSDVLGLSVRGGSVLSHVRWGGAVASPVVRTGDMDYMLAFEPLEALRGLHLMRRTACIVCNTRRVMPISVSSGGEQYPAQNEAEQRLREAVESTVSFDATSLAVEIGTPKVANILMLGAFSTFFDIPTEIWSEVVLSRVPERFAELNRKAFARGRESVREETL